MEQTQGLRGSASEARSQSSVVTASFVGIGLLLGILLTMVPQSGLSPRVVVIVVAGILGLLAVQARVHYIVYGLVVSLPLSGVLTFHIVGVNVKSGDVLALALVGTLLVRHLLGQRKVRSPSRYVSVAFLVFFFTQALSLVGYVLTEIPPDVGVDWGMGLNRPYLRPVKQLSWSIYSFLVLLSVYSAIDSRDKLRKVVNLLFVSTAIASIYALVQLVLNRLGFAARVQGYNWQAGSPTVPRIHGTAVEAGLFGNLLMFAIPVGVYAFISREFLVSKAVNLLGLMIMLTALVLTFSTIGWILLALAIVAALVIPSHWQLLGSRRRLLTYVLVAGGVILTTAQLMVPSFVKGVMLTLVHKFSRASASLVERSIWALTGLKMFADHPLLGVGIGNYGNLFFDYVPANLPAYFHHSYTAGNYYALLLAETGLVGFAGFILFAVSLLHSLYKGSRRCGDRFLYVVLVGAVISLLSHLAFHFTNGNLYILRFWAFLGLSFSTLRLSRDSPTLYVLAGDGEVHK